MAVIDSVPLAGFWSFDYGAGIAGLFGARSFNFAHDDQHRERAFRFNNSPGVFVFNADGWTALSYWFTPNVKLSGGIRADFYNAALTHLQCRYRRHCKASTASIGDRSCD